MLIRLADMAWDNLQESINGLDEETAWGILSLAPGEYLHTEGSILSQLAHVTSGKIIYASVGFRNSEIRWRDLAEKVDTVWPSLEKMTGWLNEAHNYWKSSWADIEDLEAEYPRFNGVLQPAWKLIATGIHHDNYHAGQIQLQRSVGAKSSTPPPAEGTLWEQYCKDLPSW